MPQKSSDEKRKIILRTTAEILTNARKQLECCALDWPQYAREVTAMKGICDVIVGDAKAVGYVGRGE